MEGFKITEKMHIGLQNGGLDICKTCYSKVHPVADSPCFYMDIYLQILEQGTCQFYRDAKLEG